MTDIEIARSINPKDITEVAKTLGIENKIELYGSNKAKISFVVLGSKADVASSHKRILGFKARALAIATLCFCPPLNCPGLLFTLSSKSTNFSSSNTLSLILSLS